MDPTYAASIATLRRIIELERVRLGFGNNSYSVPVGWPKKNISINPKINDHNHNEGNFNVGIL
jgi:hypothetical protein